MPRSHKSKLIVNCSNSDSLCEPYSPHNTVVQNGNEVDRSYTKPLLAVKISSWVYKIQRVFIQQLVKPIAFTIGAITLLLAFQNCGSKQSDRFVRVAEETDDDKTDLNTIKNCAILGGDKLDIGEAIEMFKRSTAGDTGCESEQRICQSDGSLDGSFSFRSCSPSQAPSACFFSKPGSSLGQVIPYLGTVSAYRSSSVSFQGNCKGNNTETRICQSVNGESQLTGSFTYQKCIGPLVVSCIEATESQVSCSVTAIMSTRSPLNGVWRLDGQPFSGCNDSANCTFDGLTPEKTYAINFVGKDEHNFAFNSNELTVTTSTATEEAGVCNPHKAEYEAAGIETIDCNESGLVPLGHVCELSAPRHVKGFKFTCDGPAEDDWSVVYPANSCQIFPDLVDLSTTCGGAGSWIADGAECTVNSGYQKDGFKYNCANTEWTEIPPAAGYCVIPKDFTSSCGDGSTTSDDPNDGKKIAIGSVCSITSAPDPDDPQNDLNGIDVKCIGGTDTDNLFGKWEAL